jgi:peptide chain release factor 1
MSFEEKLDGLVARHKTLGDKLLEPEVAGSSNYAKLSKEYSDLTPIVEKIRAFQEVQKEIEGAEAMLADKSLDKEMRDMAEEELSRKK